MTLHKREVIEWNTTPEKLRFIADDLDDQLEMTVNPSGFLIRDSGIEIRIKVDLGQWQAEQAEGKE